MSSMKSLISSFILMIAMLIVGFVLPYIFVATELIDVSFAQAGVYDVSGEWSSYNDGVFFIKLQYFIGYAIMFLGVAQFVYTATRKEEIQYNVYGG